MKLKLAFAAFATVITELLGGWDDLLYVYLVLMSLDYLTGLMKAAYIRQASSYTGYRGIFKKVGFLCAIAVTALIDQHVLHTDPWAHTAVLYFFAGIEMLSIIENLEEIGVPIPPILKNMLAQVSAKGAGASGQ